MPMTITSPAFVSHQAVPIDYTCQGANVNPPLLLGGVPPGAKSLVLIVEDVDARPKPWVHWLVLDIPPSVLEIAQNTVPAGSHEGLANGGTPGYEGPCPKYFSGLHHYHFNLYALDRRLGLAATANRSQVDAAMQEHIVARATLVGLCEGTLAAKDALPSSAKNTAPAKPPKSRPGSKTTR